MDESDGGHAGSLKLRVSAGSIERFAGGKPSQDLDRLQADKQLVLELALRNYQGPQWRRFAYALAEYGFQVVRAWIRDRKIFRQCASKGVGLGSLVADIDGDARVELASETVAKAIDGFREKVLVPGLWDPTKGATLKTFFIGQCVLQFPNVYRAWLKEQATASIDPAAYNPEVGLGAHTAIVASAEVAWWLKRSDENDPERIKGAVALGYDHTAIAKMLGTTVSGVESRLYRLKKKASQ